MKIIIQLLMRFGFAAVMLGGLSFILPYFGLEFRNADYLKEPGAKWNTLLFGLGLMGLAYGIAYVRAKNQDKE
jgi:hypothetical protein